MPPYNYSSVAIKIEIIELIQLLADEDMRSIPRAIEYLAKSELKLRLDKIKDKFDGDTIR